VNTLRTEIVRLVLIVIWPSILTLRLFGQTPETTLIDCASSVEVPKIRRSELQESAKSEVITLNGRVGPDGKLQVGKIEGGSDRMKAIWTSSLKEWQFRPACKGRALKVVVKILDVPGPVYSIDWVTYSFVYPNNFVLNVVDGRRGR
jgi:hypothetical protein